MWIHVPKSIHPSPSVVDMEGSNLASEKLSELERFAMWKSESRSAKSWSTLWNKNSSMRRLSGLTSPTSQLTSSVTVWTSSKAAFLVSHFQLQDSRREQKIPETSGPQSVGSYEALGHQSHFWRTSLASFPIISTPSDPNFLRWVTWLRRVYSQRALMAAHRRSVKGSSSWPTPRERDYKGEGYHDTLPTTSARWPTPASRDYKGFDPPGKQNTKSDLEMYLSITGNWPAPNTMDSLPPRSEEANRERFTTGARKGRTTPDNLREFVQPETHPDQWPTPSSDGSQGEISVDLERKGAKLYNKQTGRILQAKLATEVRWWPTVTQDSATMRRKKYAQGGNPLSLEAANWPTPRSQETFQGKEAMDAYADAGQRQPKTRGGNTRKGGTFDTTLSTAAAANWPNSHSSHPGQVMQEDGSGFSPDGPSSVPPIARKDTECSPTCRRLRAEFAEWLMGLPPGWTNASEQLGTEWYRSHALSLSIRLAEEGFFDEDHLA